MKQSNRSEFRSKLTVRIPVLIVMLAFVLLSTGTLTAWFRSDSEFYYQGICQSVENLRNGEFSLSNFGIAGHMCYGYSIFVFLGQLLLPYQGIGIRLVNLLLAVITIGVFFKTLRILFPKIDAGVRLAITAAFAFSPLLFGIIGEVHTDFPVLCFFVWLVYFYFTERQVACLLTGFLLCFSKEVGILYYCSFFAGCFIYRLIKNENKNWLKKIYDEFSVYEWLLLVPADLFLIRAIYSGGWGVAALTTEISSGDINSFHWSWNYVWVKLKEMFLMNFAWLLLVPFVLFIVAACRKKLQNLEINREWLVGIGVSICVFLVFNVSYFTYVHYRYLQLFLFFYMLLVVFLLEKSCGNVWIKRGFCLLLACAFLAESFVTIDPVTFLAFRNIDVGNGKLVTTNEYATNMENGYELEREDVDTQTGQFLDAGVYNREYLGFEKAFEEALADIEYDTTKAVIFPALYRDSLEYTLFGYFGAHDPWNLYWDSSTGNITYYPDQTWIQWLDISKEIPDTLSGFRELWYVKLPYQGEWYEEENLEHFKVLEERTYQSGKWKFVLERIEYRS